MGRLPRYVLAGEPQHVIQRGHNKSAVFFNEKDYYIYLKYLKRAREKYECDIHAYVLMTNHIHLLVTPRKKNSLSKMMQSLGRRYVQYVNSTYGRRGTLWEGRYRATLIDSDLYLLACYRYIELNPVRAGMVSHLNQYPWSSYHSHAKGRPDPLIQDHQLYLDLGANDEKRQRFYQCLFETDLNEETMASIRKATNSAWVLGSDRFKKNIQTTLKCRTQPLPKGGRKNFQRCQTRLTRD